MDDKREFSDRFKSRFKLMLLVMAVLAIVGIGIRIVENMILTRATQQQNILSVITTKAKAAPKTINLMLPANVLAWHEATIYARTDGYVQSWHADIGDHVKQNDLLAEIASPEIDAQLHQAEADLQTGEANSQLADITAARWVNLLKTESVSKQEAQEKISDAIAKRAIVAASKANRNRLRDLVSFERVLAPFDGIITSRSTDIGRLINAGSSGTVPLFHIVQADRLRVYVKVPEYFSSYIKPALTANLSFTEHPGKTFSAKLLNTAKAIDVTTRTLLIQLEIDNVNDELLPGSYAQINLNIPTNHAAIRLPVNTLIFRSQGMQVATINGAHKAVLKSISIGRDYGDEVEVVNGIQSGEAVIINPPDSLISGQEVRVDMHKSDDIGNL